MRNLATSFLFKEIFPKSSDFITFIDDYTSIDTNSEQSMLVYLYTKLYRYYGNSNVNYDTIEEFKGYFSIAFEDYYEQYKVRYAFIKKIYELTDEEILTATEQIHNQADNPNTLPDDPKKPLDYISQQDYYLDKGSKFYKFNDYLNKLTDLRTKAFLDRFAYMFEWIYTNKKYLY